MRLRLLTLIGLVTSTAMLSAGAAYAYWSGSVTGTPQANATAATLNAPTVSASASGSTVTLLLGAATGIPATAISYTLTSGSGGNGTGGNCASTYTSATLPSSCNYTGVASGTYTYTLTADVGSSWNQIATSSATVGSQCGSTAYTLGAGVTVNFAMTGGGGGNGGADSGGAAGGAGGGGATMTGTLHNTSASAVNLTLNVGCAGANGANGTTNAGGNGGTASGSPYASGGSGGNGSANGGGGGGGGGAGGGTSSITISSGSPLAIAGGGGGGGGGGNTTNTGAAGGTSTSRSDTSTAATGGTGTNGSQDGGGSGGGGGGVNTPVNGGGAPGNNKGGKAGSAGLSYPLTNATISGVAVAVSSVAAGTNGATGGSIRLYSPLALRGIGGTGAAWQNSSSVQAVPYPAGTTNGDLLFLVVMNDSNTATNTPSGWTEIADQGQTGFRFTVWTKLDGGETSVTVTPPGTSTMAAAVYGYDRPNGYPPNPASAATVQQGTAAAASTMIPSANVTTTQPYSTVISFAAVSKNNALSLTSAQNFSKERSDNFGAPQAEIGIADQVVVSAGAVTSPTWSQGATNLGVWDWATVAYN